MAPPPRDEVKLPPAYVVVHASPSLGDVRLCFRDAVASADVLTDPWPTTGNVPRTNYPGLAAGRGTVLRDTTVLSGVTDLIVDVYDAYAVGVNDRPKAVSCETLRNRSVQKKGTLGPVQGIAGPALLALTDCPQSGCPNGAPAELHLVPLATGTSAGAVKIQPVLLTRAIEPASVSWAGAQLATDLAFGAPSPGMEISLPTTGFESTQVALDGGQSWSLVDVQAWSDPAAVPSQFYAVKGLLVIAIVGKPGGVDVDALHPVAVAIDVGKGG